ncbi:MAG: PEP-CTERM sorting domain-containing protein [Pirellulales bacterium]
MSQPLGSATPWWFDPLNWSTKNPGSMANTAPFYLPPNNDTGAATDVLINAGTAGSTEVVFDPANDPSFPAIAANPATHPFPAGYGPQTIWRLYMGREAVGANNAGVATLRIRGDLSTDSTAGDTRWQIGRSSGTADVPSNGVIIQESGTVINNYGDVDLGSSDTGLAETFGNGTYDYRGGTFEQGLLTTTRFRLSAGGSSSAGGKGTLIMHNPDTDGHFRVREFYSASYGGGGTNNPDGVDRGVAITEFHYENGGTRAVQVAENMFLANGQNSPTSSQPSGVRSSRLNLVLGEAPTVNGGGVPNDLALFDVDYDKTGDGIIGGAVGSLGLTFSDANAANPLDPSAAYDNGDIVTAMFGASTYRWQIYYNGNINWSDADKSILDTSLGGGDGIEGMGTGVDIVLIGLDSTIVPMGLPGDFNGDHKVDAADYTVWRDHLGAATESSLNGNGDGSNGVDAGDYNLWKTNFGDTSGAGALAAAAVPEPGTVMLCLAGVFGLLGLRRRNA